MQKAVHTLLFVLLIAALGICGYGIWSWVSLDDFAPPAVEVRAGALRLEPDATEWKLPVLFGLTEREFSWETPQNPEPLVLQTDRLELGLPEGYQTVITVRGGDGELFCGSADAYRTFVFPGNGEYALTITLTHPQTPEGGGSYAFSLPVTVDVPPPEPEVRISSETVVQGDSLMLELLHLPEGEIPTAETELSLTTFVPQGDGRWIAYTGIADSCETGEYPIRVRFGDFEEEFTVTVTAGEFGRQDLWIDTSDPVISEANSAQAYQQFRDTIRPFYETADAAIYWEGAFLMPVEGRLTSEYGLLRYTNGGSTPRRHAGIDLAAAEGTPIQCPAGGRVVFSDYLLNTGNTLVIEHGGGLKTYYFHLVERDVEAGDRVEAGQLLGKVGTTGYSTGPHLHFEVRIGGQNLDPFRFFDGTGGCFLIAHEVTADE